MAKNLDYYVLIICFDRDATYSHTTRVKRSEALDIIEQWSRLHHGLCELIDMHKIAADIKSGEVRNY